jgi:hypothetical protein
VQPGKQHSRRIHNLYRTTSIANSKAADGELSTRHVDRVFNMFRHIPWIVSDLLKSDLLHTILIGMVDYRHKLIVNFMKMDEQLESTMQSGYPFLLTIHSHQTIGHMMKYLKGMGRR